MVAPVSPQISVVIPVYNQASFLGLALDSLLEQTFEDWEAVVVNDGSTDHFDTVAEGFHDPRLIFLHNPKNLGISASLNRGLQVARGSYIARFDADDLMLAARLEQQIRTLDNSPNAVLVSGAAIHIDEQGNELDPPDRQNRHTSGTQHLIANGALLRGNPITHPAVMMRRDALSKLDHLYAEEAVPSEDYDLWVRLSRIGELISCAEPVIKYRRHSRQQSSVHASHQRRIHLAIRRKYILDSLLQGSHTFTALTAAALYWMRDYCAFLLLRTPLYRPLRDIRDFVRSSNDPD